MLLMKKKILQLNEKLVDLVIIILIIIIIKKKKKTRCVFETLMPPKHPSFEKHDPDI